jgi:LemA protein
MTWAYRGKTIGWAVVAVIPQRRRLRARPHGPGVRKAHLPGALRQILALAEAYPDLQANPNFQQLPRPLSKLAHKIAALRRFFNTTAAEDNATRESFPAVLFAQSAGVQPRTSSTSTRPSARRCAAPPAKF